MKKQANAWTRMIFAAVSGLMMVAGWSTTAVAAGVGMDPSSVVGTKSSEPFTAAIILALGLIAMAVGFARRKRHDGIL